MYLHELTEAPIPDDWDKSIFNPKIPFKTRIAYAMRQAKLAGHGSARTTVEIPYEGRKTALKLAQDDIGVAQNKHEAELLSSPELQKLGLFIPLIDYDPNHLWIHTEYAEKIPTDYFLKELGKPLKSVVNWLPAYVRSLNQGTTVDLPNLNTESELFKKLITMYQTHKVDLTDIGGEGNWGMYKGTPVIIDAGMSEDLYNRSYTPKRPLW